MCFQIVLPTSMSLIIDSSIIGIIGIVGGIRKREKKEREKEKKREIESRNR